MVNVNAKRYPAIPQPTTNANSLLDTSLALKEGHEILLGVRGQRRYSAVTWDDLVRLGLIKESDIPQ